MRNYVIQTILEQFDKGADELGIDYLRFIGNVPKDINELTISHAELEKLLPTLSNEDLLYILDSQACQKYR